MDYTIDQFSKITGLNKLLLRTWENRYNFLKAKRTSTNIRYYSDNLLICALNTKFLIDSGYKISFSVKKSDRWSSAYRGLCRFKRLWRRQ